MFRGIFRPNLLQDNLDMNTVYESLRTLLRNKELEIKKLEKEIEALRIVLPIVAEAGEVTPEALPTFDSPRPVTDSKPRAISGADFENVMSQVRSSPPAAPAAPRQAGPVAAETSSKGRTTWP